MSLSDKLKALAREHAEKYDPTVAAPGGSAAPAKPLYIQDLEKRAARDGKTIAEVRARDQELLANSQYPSPQCLKAEEILFAAVEATGLRASRLEHYHSCLYCQAIVASSRPDEHRIAEMSWMLARAATEVPAPAPSVFAPVFAPMRQAGVMLSALPDRTARVAGKVLTAARLGLTAGVFDSGRKVRQALAVASVAIISVFSGGAAVFVWGNSSFHNAVQTVQLMKGDIITLQNEKRQLEKTHQDEAKSEDRVRPISVEPIKEALELAKKANPHAASKISEVLAKNLKSPHEGVRSYAAYALGRLGMDGLAAVPELTQALRDDNPVVRGQVATALGDIGPSAKDAIPGLIQALGDGDARVRERAVFALKQMGPVAKDAVPALIRCSKDPHLTTYVVAALKSIDEASVQQLLREGVKANGPAPSAEGPVVKTFQGTLATSDPVDRVRQGRYHQVYPVELEVGYTYVIDLRSRDFDAFLRLEDAAGNQVAEDDDGGGGLDARIIFTPRGRGTYKLIATSYAPGATGAFSVTVRQSPRADVFHGAITNADPFDPVREGRHHKVYTIELEAGRTYVIDLQSSDFDAYLRLENGASTQQLGEDDDSGGNFNARIRFRCEESGSYRVIVTTFARGATGTYTLMVR